MSHARILVVHPEPATIALISSMLQTLGHKIEQADSDRVAARILAQHDFDLVVAGIDPSDPDGLEILSHIRRKHPHTACVTLFPDSSCDRSKDAIRLGAAAALKFPVSANTLRAVVTQSLEQTRTPQYIANPAAALRNGANGSSQHYTSGSSPTPNAVAAHSEPGDPARSLASSRPDGAGKTSEHFSNGNGHGNMERSANGEVRSHAAADYTKPHDDLVRRGESSVDYGVARGVAPNRGTNGAGGAFSSASFRPGDVKLLTGDDPILRQTCELVDTVANSRSPLLLLGERGTGKTVLARLIHARSPRKGGPFVKVACLGFGEAQLETELFGHSGDGVERQGKLAQASGGTLLLDEIAALSPRLQFELLQFIQSGEYEPRGSDELRRADVRIFAASRENIAGLVESGQFRQDLYYRISIVSLKLPPLRRRGEDVLKLARMFRDSFARDMGRDGIEFSLEAIEALKSYTWPGNVRELETVVERGVLLCRGDRITPAHLALESTEPPHDDHDPAYAAGQTRPLSHPAKQHPGMNLRPLKEALEEPERQIILRALEALNWNRQETARVLDINRTTLYKKMKKYGLLIEEPAWLC